MHKADIGSFAFSVPIVLLCVLKIFLKLLCDFHYADGVQAENYCSQIKKSFRRFFVLAAFCPLLAYDHVCWFQEGISGGKKFKFDFWSLI